MKQAKKESFLMKFFRKLEWNSMAWSLRRLYCPVKKDDLVLEIGSGANPYPRANVLCDAYLETAERYFTPLVYDRPTVIAFAENLPFKDDTFDFVIASHVLEHSADPQKFLGEIQRIGKAGYIETPDAFFERLCSYPMHRLEVIEENGELIIYKKTAPIEDKYLNKLFGKKVSTIFPEWVSKYPFNFHLRYYWSKEQGGIKYQIINPDYKFDWNFPREEKRSPQSANFRNKLRKTIISLVRNIFSQNKRNKQINVLAYLKCIKCDSDILEKRESAIQCLKCNHKYKIINRNLINFTNL